MNKVFSKTMAKGNMPLCYIEERINTPEQKMYTYHYWCKDGYYIHRTFLLNENMLANHLMYNAPERLQQLLNDGKLYRYVRRTVRKYEKAVDEKTKEICQKDNEMKAALKVGNMTRYYALEKTNKSSAEEIFRNMLYEV